MIYTSYFANIRRLPEGFVPISICSKAPDGYKGLQYKKLAPKYDFFMRWKENHDNSYYTKCFNEQILNCLDVYEVMDDLYNLLTDKEKLSVEMTNCPFWRNPHSNIVLICYEKSTDFCHRHLVADWLEANGIQCKEWVNQ